MVKKTKKIIIFYSESETYGGHEAMSLNHIKAGLNNDIRISILYNEKNKRFKLALESAGLEDFVTVFPLRFRYRKIPFLSLLLNYKFIGSIFRKVRPDTIVILQGNPDSCLLGVLLSKLYKFRTRSYLPIPQKLSYTGGKFSAARDYIVENFIFPMFDKIITISDTLKECLIDRGVPPNKIDVVKNSVEIIDVSCQRKNELRNELGLSADDKVILLPGRVYFKQKGQDSFIRELSDVEVSGKFKYLIAGDGPDFDELKTVINKYNDLKGDILLLGWRDDVDELISIADIIALPSRFEGVPLVMLEALSQGKIVIASRRDGMKDYLPDNWLFEIDSVGDIAKTINSMDIEKEMANAALLKEEFVADNDRAKLGKKFIASVLC